MKPVEGGQRSRWVLATMCLALMLAMFNTSMAGVLLPSIAVEFGTPVGELQLIATIYSLGFAIALLPGSAIGQKIGRKHALLYGMVIFLVGSASCVAAPNFQALLGGRFLQAVGCGVFLPQTLTVLVYEYENLKKRSKAIGVWAGIASTGLVAGPVLGGGAVSLMGWRSGFMLSVLLGGLTLYLVKSRISSERHGSTDPQYTLDLSGLLLSVQWLSCLVYGLSEAPWLGWTSSVVVGTLIAALLGFLLFLYSQKASARRSTTPLMPLSIWSNGNFVAANIGGTVFFFTLFAILFFYALYFAQVLGYGAIYVGLAFVPLTLSMGLTAPFAGKLSARYGPFIVLVAGALVSALCCILMSANKVSAPFWNIQVLLALCGLGFGLMSSTSSNGAVSSVARNVSGVAAAVHTTCRQIGSTLGVTLLGLIVYAKRPGLGTADSFVVGLSLAMQVSAFLLLSCAATIYMVSYRRGAVPGRG